MFKKLTLLAAVLAATSSLAACSSDDTTTAKPTTQTAANGEKFNDADVAFGTDMIPHHAQALLMVDMTIGRELSPEFRALTEGIRDAQGPEIEQMTTWLTEWDQPIPETARDHSNSHDGMGMGMDSDMPGMMSDDDLDGLEMTMGSGFESMWLTMMIDHHEGAIEMAETELADGVHPGSLALAQDIIDGQTAEIATMKAMLG